MATSEDKPLPGERCTCGRPAVTVFLTEKFGRVGYCGIADGGAALLHDTDDVLTGCDEQEAIRNAQLVGEQRAQIDTLAASLSAATLEVDRLRESERTLREALEGVKSALGDRLLANGPLSLAYAHSVMDRVDAALKGSR